MSYIVQRTVSMFLHETWMPRKRRQVRATTAFRYAWFVEHYITPAIGDVPLRRLRVDHLENLYQQLAVTGGRRHDGLATKTILEVHMIVRAALGLATERQLVIRNVATSAQLKLPRAGGPIARSWTASELATFLANSRHHRLYPALHLAAHTGMRRGEIVGLKWCDLDTAARPILLAGIVIRALGVLDDVTVTQVSAVWQLNHSNRSSRDRDWSGLRWRSDGITFRRPSTRCCSRTSVLHFRSCCSSSRRTRASRT